MKKLLTLLAFGAVMTACNNNSEKKSGSDAETSEAGEAARTVLQSDSTQESSDSTAPK